MRGTTLTYYLRLGVGLALAVLAARAAAPRLETPVVANGTVALELAGEPGQTYRIEASSNLTAWSEVYIGVAVGGRLTAEDRAGGGSPWRFYRGVLATPANPYPAVQVTADTNRVATVLVTPDQGGLLQTEGPDRLVFTLSIPPTAVSESVPVRMTVLTNVVGVPAAGGFLSAVRLEPEGLVLATPCFLDVEYPDSLPVTQVSSYSFGNDGSQLHLVLDLVASNRVRILVNQLRSFGSGAFSLAELQALAATGPAPQSGRVALQASMEECYPDDEAAAAELHQELEEAIRPVQQKVAAILGEERQRQLLGIEEPGNPAMTQVVDEGYRFYAEELKSRMAEASQRCATTRELLPWLLGYERQRELLGCVSDDEPMDPAVNDLFCQGMKRCQEQALECCRTRGGDTRLVAFLLGLERQRQLLGIEDGNCGQPGTTEDHIRDCAPDWYGELRIIEKGQFVTNIANPSVLRSVSETWMYELKATVNSVKVDAYPPILFIPGSTNMEFKLTGLAQGTHSLRDRSATPWDACAGGLRTGARVVLHDGGDSYEEVALRSSVLSNVVNLTLTVNIGDDSGGVFSTPTTLNFLNQAVQVPQAGLTQRTTKTPTGRGCDVKIDTEYARETDLYGGEFLWLKAADFQHSEDRILYAKETTRQLGELTLTKRVTIDLKRLR